MINYKNHFIVSTAPVQKILEKLNELAPLAIAFVVDDQERLIGSITDGDIRRGFIKGYNFDTDIINFVQPNPYKLHLSKLNPENFLELKKNLIKVVPVVNDDDVVVDIVNVDEYKSLLPLCAFIMAGGEGQRLRPLTEHTPKPLLVVGGKAIIEHNIDRIKSYGIFNISISLKYLGQKIIDHLGDGSQKSIEIDYTWEDKPLGTFGAVTLKDQYKHDCILLQNSDLLTDIDYQDLYLEFVKQDADMIIATIPYKVNVPYGVTEISNQVITSLKEKPTYTYYCNAGIYIFKKKILEMVTKGKYFDATDMIELLISNGAKVINYPILSYWLDIGKHDDFEKAQIDIKHIKL